jgi:mRNA interferase RelE/StbE
LAYDVIWHEDSVEDLKKLDSKAAKKIIGKVKNYLTQDPIKLGARLKGSLKGFRRYRIGEYRVIYAIDHAGKKIIILNVNHRKQIYKK